MRKYGIFVYWSDQDECFVSEVPELPSIKAHGDNQTEALENAQQAIELWIKVAKEDGIKLPKPKGKIQYA
ncbi:type II toxin-antitoxin system HicB family antitoxin [Algoriphagus yeomjeoni]|uniref:Putative RNase H-like HicB family nuclease n=1 Tax=Algoriphagus yeomjeoni TaxID=291403 RepID=A0A327P820_9BACT|nr:type II toxin-antitoxin system HicB family antitoxin [Algoriphagus yeomjeoni]RAI88358.1 putative RNase H-like HicB family nuclease [Algoriphagus yeomjeoni]